jgi:hypothetical protein
MSSLSFGGYNRPAAVNTNYLLIDYENVQPKSLAALGNHPFKVIVFIGASQTKISVELASALQVFGANAEYIRVSGNGSNALDFHIAFTIGELSKTDSGAHFHIISKDSGFDPLIDHLRRRNIFAKRSEAIRDLLSVSAASSKDAPSKAAVGKLETVILNLTARQTGKPRKLKTLSNTINALFGKSMEDPEIASLVKALKKRGLISIDGEDITYHL